MAAVLHSSQEIWFGVNWVRKIAQVNMTRGDDHQDRLTLLTAVYLFGELMRKFIPKLCF